MATMAVTGAADSISNIIDIVEAARKKYELVKDDKMLGKTFHKAGHGLLLIKEVLSALRPHIPVEVPKDTTSLESCSSTAELLETIFHEVSQAPADVRLQSYVTYIETNGRASLVEILVIGMMEHICQLATDCAIEDKMEDQLYELRTAIDKLAKMEPSVPVNQREMYHFANQSNGSQYNATGGSQHNATNNAKQFVGSTFHALVTFN